MAAMFKGKNNAIFLHDKKIYFPKEKISFLLLSNMAG